MTRLSDRSAASPASPGAYPLGRLALLLACLALVTGAAAAHAESYPIAAERITATVEAAHPELHQVHPSVQPRSRSAEPALVAGRPEPSGQGSVRIRLSCAQAGDCVPFYVEASREASAPAGSAAAPKQSAPAHPVPLDAGVHAGASLTLLLDSGPLHLQMPVTALASAPVGGVLRVQSRPVPLGRDSHPRSQTLSATVVDAHTVRGELP
jgi:hypothetical protein